MKFIRPKNIDSIGLVKLSVYELICGQSNAAGRTMCRLTGK
jgi:hypothetical protein